MQLDPDRCYQALTSHDVRFDGLFYVGVASTGIYCRPVCPAKTPRRENCRFFRSAGVAELAGFRPCLRCRPELAPGQARIDSAGRIAGAVAQRIEDGALNEGSLEELAAEFELSSRQLRRLVQQELGLSPVELAQTQRLLFAKRLLADTRLPVTEVAFASGFSSVRRFNALFQERYRLTPSEMRRGTEGAAVDALTLELCYRPPFDWEALLGWLESRTLTGVERIEHGSYSRTLRLGAHQGWITARPAPSGRAALRVEVSTSLTPALTSVLARLRHLFDLHADPNQINAHLSEDPVLRGRIERHPGLRVPGAFDGFELGLRAILGQQVSVRAATTIAGRFVTAFGEPAGHPQPGLTHLSPTAKRIAAADATELTTLGVTRSRAASIQALAREIAEGGLRLEPGAPLERTLSRLISLPGIGEWTAQYIALRALRWPDAFPHSDLGLRQALGGVAASTVLKAAESWRPWRAYAALHLWKSLEDRTHE